MVFFIDDIDVKWLDATNKLNLSIFELDNLPDKYYSHYAEDIGILSRDLTEMLPADGIRFWLTLTRP